HPRYIALEKQTVLKAHQDTQEAMRKLSTAVQQNTRSLPEERQFMAELTRLELLYGPVALDIVKLALEGKKEEATAKMNTECRPLLATLLTASSAYEAFNNKIDDDNTVAAAVDYHQARSVLAMAAALAMGISMIRSLVRSLGGEPGVAADLARAVAQGDLSMPIHLKAGDSTSLMAQLKAMQEGLASVVSNVRQGAEGVSAASAEIAQGNSDLSGRTEQQASALEQTAASMEQLASTVNQNADSARQANQLAVSASKVAVQGGDVVNQVVHTMKGINDASRKISDIISVIDSIAFQTNILALNAAAAKEIKSLIDNSVDQVEQGTTLVATAGSTMTQVVSSIRRVTDIIGEVSAACNEQSLGVAQMGQAITQMDQVTQQNAALVEESAAAAGSLSTQAEQLLHTVEVFQLGAGAALVARNRPAVAAIAAGPRSPLAIRSATVTKKGGRPSLASASLSVPKLSAARKAPVVAKTGNDQWTDF
ncbi:MAG: methyl-accepting chemotaxis protein, partial [Ferruginibacter sp.]|nr:methyl-accepting chemotaxis protein [Rhodoferax sp.]